MEWRWYELVFKEPIEPGILQEVFNGFIDGYLVAVIMVTDNPYLQTLLDLYGDGSFEIRISPYELDKLNMYTANCELAYLTKYDTANNLYVAAMTPCEWLRFEGNFKFYVFNPPTKPDGSPNTVANPEIIVWLYARGYRVIRH